ncbi:hypothetical protein EDD86DRAFT_219662 [Gorgonomyces haynaldii]|nr:hypothetical protein EDD86DRAFT_219662 [Gorgonomyces haynaldii]
MEQVATFTLPERGWSFKTQITQNGKVHLSNKEADEIRKAMSFIPRRRMLTLIAPVLFVVGAALLVLLSGTSESLGTSTMLAVALLVFCVLVYCVIDVHLRKVIDKDFQKAQDLLTAKYIEKGLLFSFSKDLSKEALQYSVSYNRVRHEYYMFVQFYNPAFVAELDDLTPLERAFVLDETPMQPTPIEPLIELTSFSEQPLQHQPIPGQQQTQQDTSRDLLT